MLRSGHILKCPEMVSLRHYKDTRQLLFITLIVATNFIAVVVPNYLLIGDNNFIELLIS